MRVLVTGSAGFIGYHLSELLLAEGHDVTGVDNFTPYYPVVVKHRRHALLAEKPRFTAVEADLANGPALEALCREEAFDVVCHLAAQPGVRYSIDHPFEYGNSNLAGFLSVLEAVRHAKIPRLVYASSSSVYGGNTKLPFSESDPVERPISLYAATKRANELMAHTYTHLYGFQAVGLRFFTVYGPWGRPDMALWTFTEAIGNGEPISVFNHGDMMRDFTFIDDIVAGVRAALTADGLDRCEVLNIGNHRAEKLLDMIATIGRCLGTEPRMEFKPMQPGDVKATYADIDRVRAKLGFEPTTNIDEGIARFVQWYKAHPEIAEEVRRWRRAGREATT